MIPQMLRMKTIPVRMNLLTVVLPTAVPEIPAPHPAPETADLPIIIPALLRTPARIRTQVIPLPVHLRPGPAVLLPVRDHPQVPVHPHPAQEVPPQVPARPRPGPAVPPRVPVRLRPGPAVPPRVPVRPRPVPAVLRAPAPHRVPTRRQM